MATKYLQIEGRTGEIFEYSKEEKEGFKKHVSSTGKESYRKVYDKGLYGTLQNVSIRESDWGERIQVTVKNGEDYINLQIPLYTQTGNIEGRYAESIIRFLPQLQKGQGYRFYAYALDQKDSDYKTYGISVIESPNPEAEEKGPKVQPYLTYSKNPKTATEIPNLEWKVIAGKNKPTASSLENKDEFLYSYLKEAVDGYLAYDGNQSTPLPTTEPQQTKAENKETEVTDDDLDDLPF